MNDTNNNPDTSTSSYFKIEISSDQMSAFVPKHSRVHESVVNWSFEDFVSFLQRLNLAIEPLPADIMAFQEMLQDSNDEIPENAILVRGKPITPPEPSRLEWLNQRPFPRDVAIARQPFIKIIPPEPTHPGVSVMGIAIMPNEAMVIPEPLELDLEGGITQNSDGTLVSETSGKVIVDGNRVKIEPVYEILDPTLPLYREAEFPCNVKVKGDLVVPTKWKIVGNLHIEGHLGVPGIQVFGDAQIDSGIHTSAESNDGVLKIYGNLHTTYIQFSRIGVAKNCVVDSSIVQSEVRVGENLLCKGDPGVIMGSEMSCFGSIIANKIGSDKGRRTRISVYRRSPHVKPPRSKIGLLAKDTRMRVFGEVWTQRETAPYESPDTI